MPKESKKILLKDTLNYIVEGEKDQKNMVFLLRWKKNPSTLK